VSWYPNDTGSIGKMMKFGQGDYCGNVLLEILFAFCLMKSNQIRTFIPIFLGGVDKDTYLAFPFHKLQMLPDITSQKTLEALDQNMQRLGLITPPDVKTLSIQAAIRIITKYQGVKLVDLGKVLIAQETAANRLLALQG
jgi:hypothetical protein